MILEIARTAVRWLHAIAAVAWVGGSLFYVLVLDPLFPTLSSPDERRAFRTRINRAFRDVVQTCIWLFAMTGGVLAFDRLSRPGITTVYVLVLAAHIALSCAMGWLVLRLRDGIARQRAGPTNRYARWWSPPYLLLAFGLLAYLTAIILNSLYLHRPHP